MRALFVGRGLGRAGWYRAVLPAMWSGHDWAAIDGDPPGLFLMSSWVGGATLEPDLMSYDVVVLQQVRGRKWAELIRKLRNRGVTVLYEIDDYVHAIKNLPDHDFSKYYAKDHLKQHEECMRACDGAIVSTEFLKERYTKVFRDRPIWVCENGLDLGRYRLTRPQRGELAGRETITVLWAGATGHKDAALPWLLSVSNVMERRDHVSFVSVGQDFANALKPKFPERTLVVPFSQLETYPAAMMLGDVSIAPMGNSDWHKAKSTLRAMESAALGIPIVASKHYADAVIDGETGIIVSNETQVDTALTTLIDDDELRLTMSKNAKKHAIETFSMDKRVDQWKIALSEASGETT